MSLTDPLVGRTLGSCRLDALIGRGGMGCVYKAHHLALDRPVAIKFVDASGAAAGTNGAVLREQILAEARTAAKLEDPRIVSIYEVGEDAGMPYIVMQWVDGESLEDRVRRLGRLPPPEALDLIRQTAEALAVAHKAGVVHRDVKPGNVMIDARGAVKLMDFGISRPAGLAPSASEAVSGSFHFMAPEQALGGPPDPRSDLYALGATWYFALAGEPLFPGSTMDALIRHRDEAPPEIRALAPEVTERAADLLRRLLAKKVEDRPADAPALVAELRSPGMLLDTDASGSPFRILPAPPRVEPPPSVSAAPAAAAPRPVPLPPPPPEPPPAEALGSKRAFVGLLAAFGVVAFGWQWRRAGPEDWAAGAAFLALVPAALTFDRTDGWRRALGVAGCAGAAACWAKVAFGGGASMPVIESAMAAALGLCALFGTAYLGQWGQDRSERLWSRVLGPVAAAGLLASALAWTAPDNAPWTGALTERASAWWALFSGSGGGWRWLGTAGVCAALGAALRLKDRSSVVPDRKLNWNK